MKLSGRDKRLIPIVVVVVLVLSLLVFYPSRQADDRHEPSAWGIALELLSLWMSPTIPEEQTPPPATGEVRTVPFSWSDRALSAWHELTTFEPVVAIIRQDVNAQTGAISPDGQYVATGGSTLRDVALSSVAEKRIVRKFAIDHGNIRAVAFSPDGKSLATGRGFMGNIPHNESVNIWDAQSGSLIRNLPGPAVSGTMRNDVTALPSTLTAATWPSAIPYNLIGGTLFICLTSRAARGSGSCSPRALRSANLFSSMEVNAWHAWTTASNTTCSMSRQGNGCRT
jgi:WD40 repeat protein